MEVNLYLLKFPYQGSQCLGQDYCSRHSSNMPSPVCALSSPLGLARFLLIPEGLYFPGNQAFYVRIF